MDQREFEALLDRYAAGRCSQEEKSLLENWLNFGETLETPISAKKIAYHLSSLDERIGIATGAPTATSPMRLWARIATIAASVILIFSLLFVIRQGNRQKQDHELKVAFDHDISPGRSGATLQMDGGPPIQLNGLKPRLIISKSMHYSDGSPLPESANLKTGIAALTAVTGRGQRYQFILPDGSLVEMNAASVLSFPSRFNNAKREVNIQGEAYFEVAKDPAHPFVVTTTAADGKTQKVEVLGTHFNIKGYADQGSIRTTLAEGSVRISASGSSLLLSPGEQASWKMNTGTANIIKTKVDLTDALAWRKGNFSFQKARLDEVMRELSRWYDVEVIYQGTIPTSTFSGAISRELNASEALSLLNFAGARFLIEGKKIIVSN